MVQSLYKYDYKIANLTAIAKIFCSSKIRSYDIFKISSNAVALQVWSAT